MDISADGVGKNQQSTHNSQCFKKKLMIQFVAPHIDDAILSLGGFIETLCRNNKMVVVNYVFTVSDWTNSYAVSGIAYEKSVELVTTLRKNEEKLVAEKLNYDYLFLDFNDHPLRSKLDETAEQDLIRRIYHRLKRTIVKTNPCFFPAGHGHPDHVIIRDIGFTLLQEGYCILFYEDQPYAANAMYDYHGMFNTLLDVNMEPTLHPFNFDSKAELLKLYASQVSKAWLKDILNYSYSLVDNKFYERFWKPKHLAMEVSEF